MAAVEGSGPVSVTPSRVNPLASLYPLELEVDFGRHTFLIPAHPAAWWLEYLLDDPVHYDIFPDCLSDADQDLVTDAILDGDVTERDVIETILKVIEVASGRRWWITLNICAVARASWDLVGGQLSLQGIDVRTVPLGAWLDAAYRIMLQQLADSDPKKVPTFVAQIQAAPEGFADESGEDEESDAFLAAMQQG